jgi:hypothetical protein
MDIQYQGNAEQHKHKITAAMIDAAWPILDAYDPDYSSAEKCLCDIFAAMEMARVPAAKLVQVNE